jgi:hypothetical protein
MDAEDDDVRPFAPLLLLLLRVAADPQASDAQQTHTTKVMEALCQVVYERDEAGHPPLLRDGQTTSVTSAPACCFFSTAHSITTTRLV